MNDWLIRRLWNLLRVTRVAAIQKMSVGLILLWGISIQTVSAQEAEAQFVPVLTPEAAQMFAEMPDTSVHIPEVYELLTVAISIANIEDFLGDLIPEGESSDGGMFNKSTPYYKDVEAQFGAHRDHPLIEKIRDVYEPLIASFDIYGLLSYRNQSLGYRFGEEGQLVSTGLYAPLREVARRGFPEYETLPFDVNDSKTLEQLEDFAKVTNFRQFYADHQDYYDAQTTLAASLCDPRAARDWLVAQFPAAYTNHTIVLSPLLGGTHSFLPVSTPDERVTQALMFVPIFDGRGERIAEVSSQDRAAYCRQIFTEIDHGYVNPASDLHLDAITAALPDLTVWSTDETNQSFYTTPYDVFNEYMTFAAYALFLSETLPEEDQDSAIQAVEDFMIDGRSFVKFREFNQELLRLYQEREAGQTVTDLYPAVLEWTAAQN